MSYLSVAGESYRSSRGCLRGLCRVTGLLLLSGTDRRAGFHHSWGCSAVPYIIIGGITVRSASQRYNVLLEV